MNLLFIIVFIVLLLVLLLFVIALKVIFNFNSDTANMNLTLLWLYPILKVVVTNEDAQLVLKVYLLNKSIIRRTLKSRKGKNSSLDLIKQVKPTDVIVNASYGFHDPFITGVACGAIGIASQFINIDSINQNPDFIADNDYIYVDATAKVNLGSTLVGLYKARNSNSGK